MFKDDDTVMHFKRPTVQFSMKESLVTVAGECETKEIKSMLPGILNQVGPAQYKALQEIVSQSKTTDAAAADDDDDDDDVPELVADFEEASKK